MGTWKIEIKTAPATTGHEIWIYRPTFQGKVEILQPDMTTVITFDQGSIDVKPTLKLDHFIFQSLVDAIHGFKPSEGKFTEGKLEATERHLADMRQLLKIKDILVVECLLHHSQPR